MIKIIILLTQIYHFGFYVIFYLSILYWISLYSPYIFNISQTTVRSFIILWFSDSPANALGVCMPSERCPQMGRALLNHFNLCHKFFVTLLVCVGLITCCTMNHCNSYNLQPNGIHYQVILVPSAQI